MKFTIDADSGLARAIEARSSAGYEFTLVVDVHDNTFTVRPGGYRAYAERLITARLMEWTIRAGCDHPGCTGCKRVMDVEWIDPDEIFKQLKWPELESE